MQQYKSLAKLYDGFSFDKNEVEWASYIEKILKQKGIIAGDNVTDIGCGTGRITLSLYKKGYNITALDSSPHMLEVAAAKFAQNGAKIQLVNQDIRNISLHKKQNAVVSINDGINYLTNLQDVEKTFLSTYDLLDEKGIFIFDISSQFKLQSMHSQSYFEENEKSVCIWHNEFNNQKRILTMDISLYSQIEDNIFEKTSELHKQRAHSILELTDILKLSGFRKVKCYDCFSFDGPKDTSERIQFVAEK